jgi:Zn finger protein HypA/HybF involved in hydrogenase expression
MNNEEKDIDDKNLMAICNQCGFSADPDKFDPCLSPYHDLRCPECGTTDVRNSHESYENNVLTTDHSTK